METRKFLQGRICLFFLLGIMIFFAGGLQALIYDTTLTGTITARILTNTPRFGSYEYAKGTIEFQNGFTCTSDPNDNSGTNVPQIGTNGLVKGVIDLSQGAMRLTQDLHIHDGGSFLGANAFPQNGNAKGCIFLGGKTLFLDNSITLTAGYLCFSDDGTIDGQGNTINLNGGTLQVAFQQRGAGDLGFSGPMYLTLKNMTIYNANDTNNNFIQYYPSHTHAGHTVLTLENVTFSFQQGTSLTVQPKSITVKGLVSLVGLSNHIIFATSGGYPYYGSINIAHNSRLYIGPSLFLQILRPGATPPVVFTDKTSEIFFDNALLMPSDEVFKRGTIIINGKCGALIDSVTPTLGGSTAGEDMDILFYPASIWEVRSTEPGDPNRRLIIRNNDSSNYFSYNIYS